MWAAANLFDRQAPSLSLAVQVKNSDDFLRWVTSETWVGICFDALPIFFSNSFSKTSVQTEKL